METLSPIRLWAVRRARPNFRKPGKAVLGVLFGLQFVGLQFMAQLLAQAPQAAAEQYLLMKNDRVMVGQIERRGENFLIRIAENSHVTISKDQVLYVGSSLHDLYQYKLRGMIKPNTGDHFKLTRWCMSTGLLDEAVTHYQQVAHSAGEHPRVKQLAVELKDQLLKVPEFREYLGLPPIGRAAGGPVTLASATVTETQDSQVRHAGGGAPLPPEVVAKFSERVQPILLNRCSQAACHGGQTKTSLRLLEPHPRFGNQTNSDNLRSVLAFITADGRGEAPLLAYANRAHGLQRKPGIEITETQLMKELQDWIQLVRHPVVTAQADSSRSALQGGNANAALSPVTRGTEPRPVPNAAREASLDQWRTPGGSLAVPPASPQIVPPPAVDVAIPNPTLSSLPGGLQTIASTPVSPVREGPTVVLPGMRTAGDPFDPSAFNQRAHGTSAGQSSAAPAPPAGNP
jgi:hypothetical protein